MKFPPVSKQSIDRILSFLHTREDCVFLETTQTDNENFCSYIFHDPVEVLHFTKKQSLDDFFNQAQDFINKGFYLAGWFSYEFGYVLEPVLHNYLEKIDNKPLATLGVFHKPIIYDHRKSQFSTPIKEYSPAAGIQDRYSINSIQPNISKEQYLNDLNIIKEYIKAGDTYQVNYTLKLLFDFKGSPEALYKTLRLNQPVNYGAFIKLAGETILSMSPELFFHKKAGTCTVKPMKGTLSRAVTLDDDQKRAASLKNDLKNRSENVMIVDLLRNDLGRLCEKGSVQTTSMFDVETYTTLHQMTSTVTGKLQNNTQLVDIFKALFPCGSVTGAPKIRTMEIINELEPFPRGVYTGGIGFISPDAEIKFNVPIRTLILNQGQAEMGIGSGIVYDSQPEDEWRECLLKAKFLTNPNPDFQLIETLLFTQDDGFFLLEKHLARLKNSAQYFDFFFDETLTRETIHNFSHQIPRDQAARVRLLLHRDGTAELSSTPCELPARLDFSFSPTSDKSALPRITLCSTQTDPHSPFFYHKTTHRKLYNDERQKAVGSNFIEVVFENEKGEITEGSITTIFIQKENSLFTPPVTCGLLPGTFREHLLEQFSQKIQEKIIYKNDLQNADAIFIANSVRGITQVKL